MAFLLLRAHPPPAPSPYLGCMALRSISHSCHLSTCAPRPSLFSSSPPPPPPPRIGLRLKDVPCCLRNVVSPRAFMSATEAYGADQIQVLEGLEAVRKRPGMYIGDTGFRGLHHLIPTEMHPVTKKSTLETVLTVLHAGGKFGGSSSGYSVSGGLHGVGLSVVNALSEALEVTIWRDGMEYQQKYSHGKPVTTLSCHVLPVEYKERQGTQIRFLPDKQVFKTLDQLDYHTIAGRIRELAFLNPNLMITLRQEDTNPEKVQHNEYFYVGGLIEYVKWLNTDKKPLHEVVGFRKEVDGITINVALQWCSDAYSDTMLGYANSIRTADGGTHIDGLKASLTRTLNNLGKKSKLIKDKDITLSGEHVREGLTCVV